MENNQVKWFDVCLIKLFVDADGNDVAAKEWLCLERDSLQDLKEAIESEDNKFIIIGQAAYNLNDFSMITWRLKK